MEILRKERNSGHGHRWFANSSIPLNSWLTNVCQSDASKYSRYGTIAKISEFTNIWPWKWRSRTYTIWLNILSPCQKWRSMINQAVSSGVPMHFVTKVRTFTLRHDITPFNSVGSWNGIKINLLQPFKRLLWEQSY